MNFLIFVIVSLLVVNCVDGSVFASHNTKNTLKQKIQKHRQHVKLAACDGGPVGCHAADEGQVGMTSTSTNDHFIESGDVTSCLILAARRANGQITMAHFAQLLNTPTALNAKYAAITGEFAHATHCYVLGQGGMWIPPHSTAETHVHGVLQVDGSYTYPALPNGAQQENAANEPNAKRYFQINLTAFPIPNVLAGIDGGETAGFHWSLFSGALCTTADAVVGYKDKTGSYKLKKDNTFEHVENGALRGTFAPLAIPTTNAALWRA